MAEKGSLADESRRDREQNELARGLNFGVSRNEDGRLVKDKPASTVKYMKRFIKPGLTLLKFGRSVASDALPLSPEALAALQGYAFPGNVRELENILERACTLCESGVIGVEDLQLPSAPASPAFGELQEWLDHLERDRILAAIAQTGGNKTKAARVLGISFRALRYRLTRLGIGIE